MQIFNDFWVYVVPNFSIFIKRRSDMFYNRSQEISSFNSIPNLGLGNERGKYDLI